MIGENIEKYTDIAKSVVEEGHLVGNHSYSHKRLIFQNYSVIREEIDKTNELIKSIGQDTTHYFRPPYTSKYIFLPIALKKGNMILVTGTYDPPAEYVYPIDVELLVQQVIDNIEPGSIIFLHDGNDRDIEAYCLALEKQIKIIKSKGYRIIRLDEK